MELKLLVVDKYGEVQSEAGGSGRVSLVHKPSYKKGDKILFMCDAPGFYELRFEDAMVPAIVYVKEKAAFSIPFGHRNRAAYSPRAFKGPMHLITAAVADPELAAARRNLALNPYDRQGETGMWPHAEASAETRGEALFAARNAIDGILANHAHYPYPYQSWGINRAPDAWLKVEFGVESDLDSIALTLRADYPHDSHWVRASVEFSDGSTEVYPLEKLDAPQVFRVEKKRITWITLKQLIKAEDKSPYPALTQVEAWGRVRL